MSARIAGEGICRPIAVRAGGRERVVHEGVIAAALTAMMILLFLGSWRSTFIIALSIPLSVLCSIATLSALGETINLMTLGGLALAVGILVDDATVAIENIHRQWRSGKPSGGAILDRRAGNCPAGVRLDAVHLHRVRPDVFPDRRGALSVRAAGGGGGVRDAGKLRSVADAGADAGDVVLPECGIHGACCDESQVAALVRPFVRLATRL